MDFTDKMQYLRSLEVVEEKRGNPEDYPFCLPAVRSLKKMTFHPAVTFLIGENGSGKSTLLEAIAVSLGFNPEGGTLNFNFSTRDSHSSLYEYIRLSRGIKKPRDGFFFRAESYYNVATNMEKLDQGGGGPRLVDSYGGHSLHEMSHGESFFATFMNRFGGNGIYILDEPEAALSPSRQMALLARMHDLVEKDSQFIIATHSPIIMAYPAAKILQFKDGAFRETEYEDTENYQITKSFINNRDKMLKILFDEE